MFNLINIKLENFKSYKGEHTFEFPTTPGLYFLTGKNLKEPQLESNGAGKSTLLDAIYWCLYGKTLRGLKATDVITWGEKTCRVALTLNIGPEAFEIVRTQNPNSVTVTAPTGLWVADQAGIDHLLGISPDAFTYSVILPQYNQSFFELTPANKLTLFSQIMGLDSWLELSQKAAKQADVLAKDIEQQNRRISVVDASLGSLANEVKTFKDKEIQFNDVRNKEIDRLKNNLFKIKNEVLTVAQEIDNVKQGLNEIFELHQNKKREIDRVRGIQNVQFAKNKKLNNDHTTLSVKTEAAISAYKELTKLHSKCPTCLQGISDSHLKSELSKAMDIYNVTRIAFEEATTLLKDSENSISKTITTKDLLLDELNELNQDSKQIERSLTQHQFDFDRLKSEWQSIEVVISNEEKRENPYTKIISEKQKNIADSIDEKQKINKKIEDLTIEHASVDFWVAGFKRVRLFIIEETLRSLEVEVNNSLVNLGLVGWQVEFDVERENKAGGVTKGFVVLIKSPSHAEPVRWEAWSGGEAQRLQLAGDLGLANLIMQQAGLTNTIEFFDEPSKHLSKAGLLDLAETLHQRALDDEKRIFLVDHNMPEFGEFEDVITITKDKKSSSIGT